jgi:hypothetical protein
MHCWAWSSLLFWALVPGHKARHLLPAQPALSGLAAFAWAAWLSGRLRWPLARPRPAVVLAGLLALWLGVQFAYVHAWLPAHDPGRQPQVKGQQIAAHVPPDQTLRLFDLKDEGILFYYGRPARRLHGPGPPAGTPAGYYLLTEPEWLQWARPPGAEVLLRLRDEQGSPILLVRIS